MLGEKFGVFFILEVIEIVWKGLVFFGILVFSKDLVFVNFLLLILFV